MMCTSEWSINGTCQPSVQGWGYSTGTLSFFLVATIIFKQNFQDGCHQQIHLFLISWTCLIFLISIYTVLQLLLCNVFKWENGIKGSGEYDLIFLLVDPVTSSGTLWCGHVTRTCFLSLARSKLRLCLANHRPGYWSNLPCDWPNTAWAYLEQETENGPRNVSLPGILTCPGPANGRYLN